MCVYHIDVQGNKVILTGHAGQKKIVFSLSS